jgi:RNA polymerase sigma-70 factor (ECF subfamily)
VWTHPDRYNGKSKVSTWIFAIAYRKALKALRRCDEPIEDKNAATRPSPDAGPEQQLGRREVQAVLLGAIGELSADHRAVVDLTYFHEIGYREIAEIMDCPVDTVKTRMFHARRHLRSRLAGQLTDWL